MSKHDKSQRMVEALKVGDDIATPGVQGVVLAKGQIQDADDTAYTGVVLLTTVKGNDFHPFRSAVFYFDDKLDRWQSGNGVGYMSLGGAVEGFYDRTGEYA